MKGAALMITQLPVRKPFFIHAGFTLIELLVVLSIMIILVGVGLATYLKFEERQQTEILSRNLREVFISARQKARFREKIGCESSEGIIGFRAQLSRSDGQITAGVFSICGNDRVNYQPEVLGETILSFSDDQYQLSVEELPFFVDYFTLYGGAKIHGDDTILTQNITITAGDTIYGFSLDKGGDITPVLKLN